eukprot:m.252572 g.252572  ORF g.252572 m.252572 type:complete len:261 (+) comp19568_c0_seq1:175-957(+)
MPQFYRIFQAVLLTMSIIEGNGENINIWHHSNVLGSLNPSLFPAGVEATSLAAPSTDPTKPKLPEQFTAILNFSVKNPAGGGFLPVYKPGSVLYYDADHSRQLVEFKYDAEGGFSMNLTQYTFSNSSYILINEVCRDNGFGQAKFGDMWGFLLSPATQYKGKMKIGDAECDIWNLVVPNITNITLYNSGNVPKRFQVETKASSGLPGMNSTTGFETVTYDFTTVNVGMYRELCAVVDIQGCLLSFAVHHQSVSVSCNFDS